MFNKKAEMGMGTLIIFIAMILVAAIAASVLISTTGSLQNKALSTGKMTTQEVGTALNAIEIFAENGSTQSVEYWFETIKLSSGSDPLRLSDVLLTMRTQDIKADYTLTQTYVWENRTGSSWSNITEYLNCDDLTLGRNPNSSWCYLTNNGTGASDNITVCIWDEANSTHSHTAERYSFGIKYQITGTSNKNGYLNKGDVIQLCFRSPRAVNEGERFKITIVPMIGSVLAIETSTPSLMIDQTVSIYP